MLHPNRARLGYRFIAPVTPVLEGEGTQVPEQRHPGRMAAAARLIAGVAVAGFGFARHHRPAPRTPPCAEQLVRLPGGADTRLFGRGASADSMGQAAVARGDAAQIRGLKNAFPVAFDALPGDRLVVGVHLDSSAVFSLPALPVPPSHPR